jgi:syntaxin 6
MYSELQEKGSSSFDASSLEVKEEKPKAPKKTRSGIEKKSELRKTLMDENNTDLEKGFEDNVKMNSRGNGSAAASSRDDPYYVFKEDLLIKLKLVEDGLESYSRIVKNTDTAINTHEVKDSKKQLKRHIKNAESTLKDLQTTVRMVEKKREKFSHIDDSELGDRKGFTSSCTARIKQARDGINSQAIKTKMLSDQRKKSKRRLGLQNTQSFEDGNESEQAQFIGDNHASAQMMMQQQDETLDDLDDAVVRVGHMAGHIDEELRGQNKMLNELEDDLQNAEEQLGMVTGKLGELLKTKNKWQLRAIMIMCLIVVILLFLVMYV